MSNTSSVGQPDPQLIFHHQLMGRSTSSLPHLLPTPPGSPLGQSPSIIDPFGDRSSSPSPYHHALSYRNSSVPSPPYPNQSLLKSLQPQTLSTLPSSSSNSPTSASSLPTNASAHLSVSPPTNGSIIHHPHLHRDFVHTTQSDPNPHRHVSINSVSSHRFSRPLVPFDPDHEAEKVRLRKLEMRRSLAHSVSQDFPSRPPSSQSFSPSLSSGRSGNLQNASLRSRGTSRLQGPNGTQVYKPSPLRSASTPDLINSPVVDDPRKRHQQLKEEYEKMRKDRIEEERERLRMTKKKSEDHRRSAWIPTSVKTIRIKKHKPVAAADISPLPPLAAAKSDVSDVTDRSQSIETDSSYLSSSEANNKSYERSRSIGIRHRPILSTSTSTEGSPRIKDPFRKSVITGGGTDEPNTPIKIKLARARQPKTLKKKISFLLEGFRNNPPRAISPRATDTQIDVVDSKSPLTDPQTPLNLDSNSGINSLNASSWIGSLRIKAFKKNT